MPRLFECDSMKKTDGTDRTDTVSSEVSIPEAKVIRFLSTETDKGESIPEENIKVDQLSEREISSAVSWLQKKNLVEISRKESVSYSLSPEGERFLKDGLPEERAFELARKKGSISVSDLMKELGPKDGKIAVAQLAKFGLKPVKGIVSLQKVEQISKEFGDRKSFLEKVKKGTSLDKTLLEHFKKREDVISEKKRNVRFVALSDSGRKVSISEEENADAIGEITTELLQSGKWKSRPFRRYDLNAPVERIYSASFHPITHLINKVRRIFLDMGFTEMDGHYIEYAGWNMDALFIPQDHPAREMQDTFYIKTNKEVPFEDEEILEKVKKTHEEGIEGYTGWGYKWSPKIARELLLRTHTTVSTIRYLYNNPTPPQASFSVEKVFRHESVDWKHLAELHQIEGTYYAKDANLSTLLWLMKEFYSRLGFKDLKFIPSYYPYTEPSLDVVVKINGKEMELGGSGVFRPEVTKPLGLTEPVVAWGLGLERLAMIYYGFEDIRDIYQSDLDWLRTFSIKH